MKIGDLVYHTDDWDDKKPIVGIILGFNHFHKHNPDHKAKVVFTDDCKFEWWELRWLRVVNEDR